MNTLLSNMQDKLQIHLCKSGFTSSKKSPQTPFTHTESLGLSCIAQWPPHVSHRYALTPVCFSIFTCEISLGNLDWLEMLIIVSTFTTAVHTTFSQPCMGDTILDSRFIRIRHHFSVRIRCPFVPLSLCNHKLLLVSEHKLPSPTPASKGSAQSPL